MTNKMWGGRFASGPGAIMEEINASIGFDFRLALHDIEGSNGVPPRWRTPEYWSARTRKR